MRKILFAAIAPAAVGAALLFGGVAQGSGFGLRLSAGRANPPYEHVLGGSTVAQAQWTNKEALNGKFSILLEKDAPTTDYVFAGATITGVDGLTVAELGDLEMAVKGNCTAGSPRFNLYYDNDGDGQLDGVAFYGCGNHITESADGWTSMSVDSSTYDGCYAYPSFGPCSLTEESTVVQLSVIVDETGTYYVDDITVAGTTLGEPSAK